MVVVVGGEHYIRFRTDRQNLRSSEVLDWEKKVWSKGKLIS